MMEASPTSAGSSTSRTPSSRASIEITIQTESLYADEEKLTKHLKSPDFFDVEKFPTATFKSTAIEKTDDGHTITGDLTLHGVTKRVSFPATVTVTDGQVTANSEFSINRKDFGIVYPGMPDDLIRDLVVDQAVARNCRVRADCPPPSSGQGCRSRRSFTRISPVSSTPVAASAMRRDRPGVRSSSHGLRLDEDATQLPLFEVALSLNGLRRSCRLWRCPSPKFQPMTMPATSSPSRYSYVVDVRRRPSAEETAGIGHVSAWIGTRAPWRCLR